MSQAVDQEQPPAEEPAGRLSRASWLQSLRATSTRRALLLTALGGLIVAGLATALPTDGNLLDHFKSEPSSASGRGNSAFSHATRGDCLMWPNNTLDAATVVDCAGEHKFEVAESVDMRTFPGAEYGPDAAPPSAARIEQITQEQCESAVRRYLGPKFDPHSKFVASMLWSGDRAWRLYGERRMLCGLQLPGPDGQQLAFTGTVAGIDQSKVWPAGTCLGIDPTTGQPTDVPVDCAAPHAKEVTGTVNLAERFPDALPAEAEQDTFIKEECTRLTEGYLAPVQLRNTTLTLTYTTISLPSWAAGSREVACSIGATLGNGGWAALLNSARGPLLINGQSPVPPPEIPAERLNLPPIPVTTSSPASAPTTSSGTSSGSGSGQGDQHLPQQQPAAATPQQQASQAPAQQQSPPPQAAPPPQQAPVPQQAPAPQAAPPSEEPAPVPPQAPPPAPEG